MKKWGTAFSTVALATAVISAPLPANAVTTQYYNGEFCYGYAGASPTWASYGDEQDTSSTYDTTFECPTVGTGAQPSSGTVYYYSNSTGVSIQACTTYEVPAFGSGGQCSGPSIDTTQHNSSMTFSGTQISYMNAGNFNYIEVDLGKSPSAGNYNALFGYTVSY